jgi:hypothetical protein
MTDENERPPYQQNPDETPTQWVASPTPADPTTATTRPEGWFGPASTNGPTWATWDEPWDQSDQPFDQTASEDPPAVTEASQDVPSQAATAGATRQTAPLADRSSSWGDLPALRILGRVGCPILLLLGLTFGHDGRQNGWDSYRAWAIFAAVCAVIQLAPLAGRWLGLAADSTWFLAAVGTAGLVGYWVIIVLPGVSSNAGFAQTLAAGFAVIALWLTPGRRV